MIEALFEFAWDSKPSLIVMEECDAIGWKRTHEENDIEWRVKIEFLRQLDLILNDIEDVVFIATTNVPWELDAAFLWRF